MNFKKTTRLEDAEFSLSEKENEGAGRSFSVSILENEGAVEKGAFSKERSITVTAELQSSKHSSGYVIETFVSRTSVPWEHLSSPRVSACVHS